MRADPYRVWLSEVMLQQTTVAAVIGYFRAFTQRWPDVHALAAAPLDDVLAAWAGLGYYARARNLHKCATVVSESFAGRFPQTEEDLRTLPGIGAYTAAAIAAIAFDRRATVVDGNVERVIARIHALRDPLPGIKAAIYERADALTPSERPGDYAQALMDLGATICTPRNPACALCPWNEGCEAHRLGIADTLPARAPKKQKPVRQGVVWAVLSSEGRVLTCRRPETGLLGGMLALPCSEWAEQIVDPDPPLAGDWACIGEVRHTFTHFHLVLEVRCLRTDDAPGEMIPLAAAEPAMPTVFRKVCRLLRQPAR